LEAKLAKQKTKYDYGEIERLLKETGSPRQVAEILNCSERRIYEIRNKIMETTGKHLVSYAKQQKTSVILEENRIHAEYTINKGRIIVASDCHYWPEEATTGHKALVELIKEFKPSAIVLNGDVFDGARVSRHDPLYGYKTPTVKEEIDVCQERLGEIERASHNSKLFWTYGNHDTRLWRYIRMNAPEVSGTPGTDIFDYFPGWNRCYVIHVNNNTVIKHRWHNGVHATYNNTLKGGRNVVTGHLHRLCVTPWGDYNGRRYGVDTGTLAEPKSDQFAYLEGNAVPWASGFAVLTFDEEGNLLPPELCEVVRGHAYFRGERVL